MPRPRAIQPGGEVEKRLLEALGTGAPIRLACGYAGISHEAYYSECERNPDFADKATRTRHQAAIRNLAYVQKAAPKDWRAAEAALKLMFPQDFAKTRVEHSGPEGGPIQVEDARERLAGELDRLAERQREAQSPQEPQTG